MKTVNKNGQLATPSELAISLGISAATVNYYTNLGLFQIKERQGNTRLYDVNEIRVTHDQIRQMRKEGYSLRVIHQRLNKGYAI